MSERQFMERADRGGNHETGHLHNWMMFDGLQLPDCWVAIERGRFPAIPLPTNINVPNFKFPCHRNRKSWSWFGIVDWGHDGPFCEDRIKTRSGHWLSLLFWSYYQTTLWSVTVPRSVESFAHYKLINITGAVYLLSLPRQMTN